MEWWEIASYVIGIAGIVLGSIFAAKWHLMVKLLLELGEAFTKTGKALEDKKLTKEEALECLKEWQDVYATILEFLPKSIALKITKGG